jgi:hypothetical protein
MIRHLLVVLVATGCILAADPLSFKVARSAEVVAELQMRSEGADWSRTGSEGALATVVLNGQPAAHVMLFAGEMPYTYRVFLGELEPGEHQLRIERHERHSAKSAPVHVLGANFVEIAEGHPDYAVFAHAPVLFARGNTIGKFSDIPLLTYCERLQENGRPVLQYTVIFSNEDGGTSTRGLMARWGRTTDIEYVYRAYFDSQGNVTRAIIQSRDHKDIEFSGPFMGRHPLLMPVTDNNMVAPEGPSPVRYQLVPIMVDLSGSSREKVMEDHPVTWRVMTRELVREGKLRPFGAVDGEKISDPRNYLYIEANVTNKDSRTVAVVRLQGENRWRFADLGRFDYGIERSGWIQTAVELPPGTTPDRLAEIGFACRVETNKQVSGVCRIEQVRKAFFLNEEYRPGTPVWSMSARQEIPSGEVFTWPVRSR